MQLTLLILAWLFHRLYCAAATVIKTTGIDLNSIYFTASQNKLVNWQKTKIKKKLFSTFLYFIQINKLAGNYLNILTLLGNFIRLDTQASMIYILLARHDDGIIILATTWLDFSLTLNTVATCWMLAKLVAALLPACGILPMACIMQA